MVIRNDTRRYRGEMTCRPAARSIEPVFNPKIGNPMKRWIKRTLFAVFGLTVLAGGLAACSHHGPHGSLTSMSAEDLTRLRAKLIDRATRELQLDEAQKQNLGLLLDRFDAQRKLLAASDSSPRATMQALVAGDHFDRERANMLLIEKTDFARVAGPEIIAAAADFYDLLRPEQQAKVRELLNKRHGWRG